MAILVSLFGYVGQQAGRIVTTTLGWASTLLFGRVSHSRQLLLSLITLGSLAWVAMVAGVLIPSVGTFLLAAVPAPNVVDQNLLFRMRLQVERDLLADASVGEAFPGSAQPVPPRRPEHLPVGVPAILGAAGVLLAALDVGVALMDRLRPSSR